MKFNVGDRVYSEKHNMWGVIIEAGESSMGDDLVVFYYVDTKEIGISWFRE